MVTAVLIPARDEAPRLAAVLERARRAVPDARLVVVDGHSSDGTAQVARRAGATVVAQRGHGYASAVREGHRWLLDNGVARAVQLDGDGQHPPESAPELLAALSQASWVVGSRSGTQSDGGLARRAGNQLLAQLVAWRLGRAWSPNRDVTSGFWAVDTQTMAVLAQLDAGVADANLRVLAQRRGLRMVEVPVCMPDRDSGASMHDGWAGVRNLGRSVAAVVRT